MRDRWKLIILNVSFILKKFWMPLRRFSSWFLAWFSHRGNLDMIFGCRSRLKCKSAELWSKIIIILKYEFKMDNKLRLINYKKIVCKLASLK